MCQPCRLLELVSPPYTLSCPSPASPTLFPVPWRYWSLPRHLGRRRTLGDLYTSGWAQGGAHRDFLCWQPCVHVGLLCMCHPCSSLLIPLLSQLLLLMFGLRNHSSCFSPAEFCLNSWANHEPWGWCLKVGSGGEAPAGCDDGTFSAWSPLQEGVGNQTLPELCHSQKINAGNPVVGIWGCPEGWILEADFSPNGLHPVVALTSNYFCASSERKLRERGAWMDPFV